MASVDQPIVIDDEVNDTPLPYYLAKHVNLGFNSDDLVALISSIESSQKPQTSALPHLPAELLLLILEYVPIDYVLDWRLVCRGFRDAIDGRVLYRYLQRAELIGTMGSRDSGRLSSLSDEEFDQIHLLRAPFLHIDNTAGEEKQEGPVWGREHAVFQIGDSWFQAFRQIGGAAAKDGDTVEDADTKWLNLLDRLELRRAEKGFGTLRWCLKLDHAVLDMDFPLEVGRNTFDVDVHLHKKSVRVAWKPMLFQFLKTERALRKLMKEERDPTFTFSRDEDYLRSIRRQRLHSSLDPENKVDRHIKWSLRLLPPLFGKPSHDHALGLEDVENKAINLLLLLRREAAMSIRQLAYLRQLAEDRKNMDSELQELDQTFRDFKSNMSMPGFEFSFSMQPESEQNIPRNPIAWPDDLRSRIEERVAKWKSQKKAIEQMQVLLTASNETLAVPDDGFDDLDSDF
ncbi:hypothetical protein P153DRAFT_369292 [Dothidotthia symphoricarpi CBS 119687]|uniref:F-box domain-containing protein n=1 Tax=Dothidotthia symphoricarpi CBS 119687 TaxID=1392245 RepID=A0A6A6A4X9_9PLEO|nr:uncharacterized protein P153DRAFT_369292 [Dothidotthia symphoricarpi CBS 119687]KAF2126596.1 hypothetical protein P153DRAFT_369292 [Dothidotthia symphoricarpi CBS 119687]